MRTPSFFAAILLGFALTACTPANPVLDIEGGKIQGVEASVPGYSPAAPEFMVFDLSADGTRDASTMGKPLARAQ